MEPWRPSLPVDKTSPSHQPCAPVNPSIQAPYGWQLNYMEDEDSAPIRSPQPISNTFNFQRSPSVDNLMNPLPSYNMPCPPYPQTYLESLQHHSESVTGSQRVEYGQLDTENQGTQASADVPNACYLQSLKETSDRQLPSNQICGGQDCYHFQRNPECEYGIPHVKAVPYPVSPEQVVNPDPFNCVPHMPTPLSSTLWQKSALRSFDQSSFDQPIAPITAGSCQFPPDLHQLGYDPKWLAGGYHEDSPAQVQEAIPPAIYSPSHFCPTFKMSPSKEPEQHVQPGAVTDPFIEISDAEEDSSCLNSSQLPIGFEALGHTSINVPYQCSDSPSVSDLPHSYETESTLDQPSQPLALLPASSMNFPQPDVQLEPSVFDFPISNQQFSPQPSKNTFSTSFDSKGELLPLGYRQVYLIHKPEGSNEEFAIFHDFLKQLRAKHPSSDLQSNPGLITSIVTAFPEKLLWVWSIPVTIVSDVFTEPIQTLPYAGSTVAELIHMTLCNAQQHSEANNDYVLKLCDAEEVLQNSCTLGSHECLQFYMKLGKDIKLQLLRHSHLQRVLARTNMDDQDSSALQSFAMETSVCKVGLSRKVLSSKLSSYHNELKSLLSGQKSTSRIVEEVKAICYMLYSVETKEITDAIQDLNLVVQQQQTSVVSVHLSKHQGLLIKSINALTAAISHLIYIYCRNFDTDCQIADVGATETVPVAQAQTIITGFSFNIYAVHRIPSVWAKSYENLFVSCSLKYGGNKLCPVIKTEEICITKPSLFHLARWNQRICMPIEIRKLPCEATLSLVLHGYRIATGNHSDNSKFSKNVETLARASMAVYSSQQVLVHSTKLLCLVQPNASHADTLILQIDFPDTQRVKFSRPVPATCNQYVNDLDEVSRKQFADIQQKHSFLLMEENEKNLLWAKRSFCNSTNCFLPLLLGCGLSRDSVSLPEIYAILKRWSFSENPLESLALLLSRFSDQELRQAAVQQIGNILNDELLDYLPQLVQAIKFEWHLNSPLVEFLLDRSIRSIRVSHQLYWLLKDGLADSQFKGRYGQLLAALLCCSGRAMQKEFEKETKLIEKLAEVAKKVWAADQSKRSTVLAKELEEIEKFFYEEQACRLPVNPAFAVKGIDVSACSYFTSNAVPLKVSFINANTLGKNVNVIFKTGDDLRQDMLVLQIVKLMDRIWCQEGLNMSMIIYRCISTGRGRGMVEMIPGATTLAKIHMQHGITGPFKEDTLSKWFQANNPTEDLHKKAMENFVSSCAGWCVATFVLGICDRHNDNIMLKTSGHLFHIDFGKFLGHAQMILNMKRDRVPFIFTAEMEHFITEGGKNGAQFQRFVDLSCQAYNIIRHHTQLLMNLLELMLSAGLPELSEVQDLKYVYNNLRPMDSDAQATSYFTSLIKESLKSIPVKINFFAHIMAQKKFAGANVQPVLSFAPETYTLQTDGLIRTALVCGFEKKIAPHKEYFYKIQVEREEECEATFIERSYNQFVELNHQLHCCFPASELPRFPYKPLIELSKGRELARKRKDELNAYVRYLLNGSPHVAKSDLVYTFFHCFPNNERASVSSSSEAVFHTENLSASTQLRISWANCKLSVMVKHIKNIFLPDGSAPDAYVKIYLLPDAKRMTKRKTNVVQRNSNPTYNEILEYAGISRNELPNRVIQLSVWCRQTLLGAVNIPLRDVKLEEDKWYKLGNCLI
ncbi:phosphatidylinositol 3-kinase C2 domain-containing subunit gamma-like isoform X1 [Hemitrygon akajei]|uniref:phosphatidylinositol 3-kinase C2 domain-containing subunit gamma-like isoform X1 n=1 Tax=Hemitrygon akajei TaxID=2704970 RepID=UPI003BFA13E5